MTPAAIVMLKRVKRLILAEPKRMMMKVWFGTKENADFSTPSRGFPVCGMVGCIGGWIEELYHEKHPYTQKMADKILGLTEVQKIELFYARSLTRAPNQQTKKHAEAVAAHIDRFIEKYR